MEYGKVSKVLRQMAKKQRGGQHTQHRYDPFVPTHVHTYVTVCIYYVEGYDVLHQLRNSFVTVSCSGWVYVTYMYTPDAGSISVGKSFSSVKKSMCKVCVYEAAHTLVPMGVSSGTANFSKCCVDNVHCWCRNSVN